MVEGSAVVVSSWSHLRLQSRYCGNELRGGGLPMNNWTRSDRLSFYHLVVAVLGVLALFVVPRVQSMLALNSIRPHLESRVDSAVSNSYDSPPKAVKKIENRSNYV